MLKKMVSILAGTVLTVTVSANVQAATITVQKGDTLWDLSQSNSTSVENIKVLNKLTSDLIHPGDVLTITPQKQYKVELGDTLWDIAKDYQVTVSQIKEWNHLQSDLIHPGLNLLIFEGIKTTTTDSKEKSVKSVTALNDSTSSVPAVDIQKESTNTVPEAETQKESTSTASAKTDSDADLKEITVEATAYTATCEGCSGITSTGINLLEDPDTKVISVDPSVIPLGSKVHVEGYGEAIAGDTGGAIKGKKIDVFIPNKQDAINFGRKELKVTILD